MLWITDHAPVGHRFLVQWIGPQTEEQARAEVCRCFKRTDVVLVRGVYRRQGYKTENDPWFFEPDGGYMAFVPGADNSKIRTCNRRRVGVEK
jgi:hypothetical protein